MFYSRNKAATKTANNPFNSRYNIDNIVCVSSWFPFVPMAAEEGLSVI